jgi:hypothetical protein
VGSGTVFMDLRSPPAIDAVTSKAYVGAYNRLYEIDLTNGDRNVVYDNYSSPNDLWIDPRALAVDSENSRVFIKGTDPTSPIDYIHEKSLVAVDLAKSSLSTVSGLDIGSGIQLDATMPYGMVFDDTNSRVILQSVLGLVYVDVNSGDRVIMTNYNFQN